MDFVAGARCGLATERSAPWFIGHVVGCQKTLHTKIRLGTKTYALLQQSYLENLGIWDLLFLERGVAPHRVDDPGRRSLANSSPVCGVGVACNQGPQDYQ